MSKSYLITYVEKFEQQSFLLPIQESFFEYEGEAEVQLQVDKTEFYSGFNQYKCHHDYKHKKFGKAFNKTFSYYFEPKDFYLYYNKTDSLALIQTKTDIALDYIDKINSSGFYKLIPVKVDFTSMYPLIPEVSGAWIADLKRAYLKTAGYFGPNVNKDEEFKKAAEEGQVSSLQMRYISQVSREEHTVTISKKGSIVIHDTLDTIEDELEVVLDIYKTLFKYNTANKLAGRKR